MALTLRRAPMRANLLSRGSCPWWGGHHRRGAGSQRSRHEARMEPASSFLAPSWPGEARNTPRPESASPVPPGERLEGQLVGRAGVGLEHLAHLVEGVAVLLLGGGGDA